MDSSDCFLVFDADPIASAYLDDVVSFLGYRTQCCSSLPEVQRRLEACTYTGLILDGRTLQIYGQGFLRWLRKTGRAEPVILISAHSGQRPTTELPAEARLRLLPNPLTPSQLRPALRWAVRQTENNETARSGGSSASECASHEAPCGQLQACLS